MDQCLSDDQYAFMSQFLPPESGSGKPGRPYIQPHRQTLDGVLYKLRSGCQWKYLPSCYGNWHTIYSRFSTWVRDGLIEQIFRAEVARDADLSRVMVDGTFLKTHICAHGARRVNPDWGLTSKQVQAIGKSKGGHTTLVVAMTDRVGRFVDFTVWPGNTNESRFLRLLVAEHPVGEVLADRGYDDIKNLVYLSSRGIKATIPPRKNRKNPQVIDWDSYGSRHLVENAFADLKQWRGLTTRDCKEGWMFEAFLHLGMFIINTRPTRRSYSPHDPLSVMKLEAGRVSRALEAA